ncbi:DNA methyltransferase [Stutzerimonas nitrititolerans]|uniref:DNA methyltransferase n=1 Tax=Stutzerimonas nitrititolerans TaxID=2482751 RepID=UPI0028991FE1|nr:DNA methyltransferase [Stutzerimonas nitrititolerans]
MASMPSVDASLEYKTTFEEWIKSREISCWGTNSGAEAIAFQSWRHFKEAFAPELIRTAVEESPIPVKRCLDPFGGSGTTALACQFLGVHPVTVEVNPYLADLIESKLTTYDPMELSRELGGLINRSYSVLPNIEQMIREAPITLCEPGDGERWIFNRDISERLACLLQAISEVKNNTHARFFRSILGGVLVSASNIVINGKGRRYRRDWKGKPPQAGYLDTLFRDAAVNAIGDITRYGNRKFLDFTLYRGDSRELAKCAGEIDLCVFSPPYPNSFDYTDVYNVELWALGYLSSKEDNRTLRNETLSSHVQIHRQYASAPGTSALLNDVLNQLKERRSLLWNKNIPEMVGAYFADLLSVIAGVKSNLRDNGTMWIVVGDSKYAGIAIPVAKILIEILIEDGWRLLRNEPFRSMRVSAQQGGQLGLDETLIVFQRAVDA